jgi:hypothetical protein
MSDSEKLPTDEHQPEPMPSLPADVDFKHLAITAIHMNELFNHLKRHGFEKEDALHLVGMVLSSGVLFKYYQEEEEMFLDEFDEPEDGEDFV